MIRIGSLAMLLLSPALLLLSPTTMLAAPGADAPSMTGLWKVTGDVMGTPVRMMCNLTETNHTLSGVCSGEQDGYAAHKISGSVKARKAEFHFQTAFGGNPLTLIVSGTTNEDMSQMDGGLDVEPMAVGGSFTAVREQEDQASDVDTTPAAPGAVGPAADTTQPGSTNSPSQALQPVVSGTWKIDGEVQGTPVKMTCVLSQAEHRLTGTCTGAGDDTTPRTLAGMIMEGGPGWRFDSQYQGQPITVTMRASLTSDRKMSGTIAVSPFNAEGTFAGVKQ
jgi:hypothetical protein